MAVNSEHAVKILSEIFVNGIQSDLITLIAGVGGQRIPIHRNILTANSKYFAASFGPNYEEAKENEFILDETDGQTLKAIVDFCYTGRIDLTEENVSKYLAIASGVELCHLEEECSRFLADKLNINNVVTTLLTAEKFNGQGHVLRQKAFDSVCELFDKLPPSHIDGLDRRLLEEILKSDAVYAEESVIFERVLSWCRKDQDERRFHMTEVLRLIRLPLIPTQYFNDGPLEMIYREFGCLDYLYAELKKRITCPTSIAGCRRRRSIYCLIKQRSVEVAQQTAVKIERYISALNEFEEVGEIDLGHLKGYGATLHGNKVYILGGLIGGVAQKSVSAFDLTSGEKTILPEMASARAIFHPILVGKFIYVFGGCDSPDNGQLASCERFDLESETWQTLNPMGVARCAAAVGVLNGYIYVAGGTIDLRLLHNLRDVELFDPQNDAWSTLPPMNNRFHNKVFTSENYLYSIGKSAYGEVPFPIERYDPLTNLWTKIGSLDSYKIITSSVEFNDSIYAITRDGEFGEMKTNENRGFSFNPLAKTNFQPRDSVHCLLFHN